MLMLQIGDRPLRFDQDSADLERQGFHRERADTPEEAISFLELYDFDIVLADLDLRTPPGVGLIREIRAISRIPIIGITTSPDPRVKISALDLGADDVITQICGRDEILARIRAVVRRRYGHTRSTLQSGRLELDLVAREARIDDVALRLGPKEFLLLEFLLLKRGSAASKTSCMTHLYGTDDFPETKTIDVVLCRLRKRLAPFGLADMIESVWGFGYKLNGPAMEAPPVRDAPVVMRQRRLVAA
jgi:two-component system, cell cycle response regulator CtrA